jgi:Ca-activated chloride channel family protein
VIRVIKTLSALISLLASSSFFFPSAILQASRPPAAIVRSQSCEASSQRQISLNLQNKENQFVDNLRTEDVTITEDNLPREIVRLATVVGEPLSVVILIDNSVTQEYTLENSMLGAQKLVEWNLKNKLDRAALISFSLEATVEEDLTNDWKKLLGAISRITVDRPPDYLTGGVRTGRTPPIRARRQGSSAMWDAVWASTDGILKTVTNSRRVIVLFTGGEDWTSSTRMSETIQYAAANDVSIFSIDMTPKGGFYIVGRSALTELAEETGGRSFDLKKVQNFPEVLQKIDRQARSHYLLTYCAANQKSADSPQKIKIEIKNPALRQADLRLSYPRYVL